MFQSLCKRNESGNIGGNAFLAAYGENNHRLPAITVMSCPRPPAVTKNLCLTQELKLYRNHSERILTCQWDMRSFFFLRNVVSHVRKRKTNYLQPIDPNSNLEVCLM